MKTTIRFLILMAIMSLTFCKPENKQVICPDRVQVVTLRVDTDVNDKNSFEYANFGQDPSISNEKFTTKVKRGDIVIWEGISVRDPSDVVNITSIKYEASKENGKSINFFGKDSLRGNGDKNQLVVGAILNGNIGDTMIYSLDFNVQKKEEKPQETVRIDPKMHM